jgi:hypothetical protein
LELGILDWLPLMERPVKWYIAHLFSVTNIDKQA